MVVATLLLLFRHFGDSSQLRVHLPCPEWTLCRLLLYDTLMPLKRIAGTQLVIASNSWRGVLIYLPLPSP